MAAVIGASLSEPHIDEFGVEFVYHVFLVACSSQIWNAKLQMIIWLESTNRIQVIMWHFSVFGEFKWCDILQFCIHFASGKWEVLFAGIYFWILDSGISTVGNTFIKTGRYTSFSRKIVMRNCFSSLKVFGYVAWHDGMQKTAIGLLCYLYTGDPSSLKVKLLWT